MNDARTQPEGGEPAEPVQEPALSVEPEPVTDDLARLWRPLKVGEPLPLFEPKPPSGLSYRPDTVCDGWSTKELHLRLASVRGYQHRADGSPREDDVAAAWDRRTGTVVFAVADGVSAAEQPHIGSQLACRSAVETMLAQVREGDGFVADWDHLLKTVRWQLVEQTRRILRHSEAGAEQTARLLATTLVAGTATPAEGEVRIQLVSIGDSGAWQIKRENFFQVVGGKMAGADGLVSCAVDPLPFISGVIRPTSFPLEQGTVLLVGTDGFGDPLGDGAGEVATLFRARLRQPVPPLGLAHLLDFSRETFDDDRTLVVLWLRTETPGGRP
ncbi:protein phosphatase 2C domain-containing protein [Streptomyces dioscori]|nr:protein phosphatase 2C domain-containing protein [Streptomyces dioscori]